MLCTTGHVVTPIGAFSCTVCVRFTAVFNRIYILQYESARNTRHACENRISANTRTHYTIEIAQYDYVSFRFIFQCAGTSRPATSVSRQRAINTRTYLPIYIYISICCVIRNVTMIARVTHPNWHGRGRNENGRFVRD